jgi:hypothetical protein
MIGSLSFGPHTAREMTIMASQMETRRLTHRIELREDSTGQHLFGYAVKWGAGSLPSSGEFIEKFWRVVGLDG